MIKYLLVIGIVFCTLGWSNAQVGIGTTNPESTLDIRSSSQSNPSNTDGILIPKMDGFPATNPTVAQDGMLIFITGNGTITKGFYYWNNTTSQWVTLESPSIFYESGTTNIPTDVNSNVYRTGSIKIGGSNSLSSLKLDVSEISSSNTQLASYRLQTDATNTTITSVTSIVDMQNTSGTVTAQAYWNEVTGTGDGNHSAIRNIISNTGFGQKTGLVNEIGATAGSGPRTGISNALTAGNLSSNVIGINNYLSGGDSSSFTYGTYTNIYAGDGTHYGNYSLLNSAGSGNKIGSYVRIDSNAGGNFKYGHQVFIDNTSSGTHYGIHSNVTKSGSFAGYFLGNVSIGTTPSNNYILPSSRGAINDIMVSDGSGNLSWANINTIGVQRINDLFDGISDNDGTDNGSSIYIGLGAGINDDLTDNRNSALGFNTLNANTSGTNNVAIGYNSLLGNTNGFENVALGYNALRSNTSGSYNVAIGHQALNDANGLGNVAIGYQAGMNETGSDKLYIDNSSTSMPLIYGEFDTNYLQVNGTLNIDGVYQFPTTDGGTDDVLVTSGTGTTSWRPLSDVDDDSINNLSDGRANFTSIFLGNGSGDNYDGFANGNLGVGINALNDNTSGEYNTAIGHSSMASTTTGLENVALGSSSLFGNTTGSHNVAIGNTVLFGNTIGEYNTAIGNAALSVNTTGNQNTAIGFNSLRSNNNGSSNLALGHQAGFSNVTGDSNIFIGYEAGYNELGSNRLYIENSNADQNSALIYGEFDTNLLRFNGNVEVNSGSLNADSGTLFVDNINNRAGIGTLTPGYRLSVNGQLNLNEGIGGGNVALRVNGSEAIWYNGTYFRWGFGGTSNYFADDVGVNTTTPSARLHVSGSDDVTLSTVNNGLFVLGDPTGVNLAMDSNEIMARNNGNTSDLLLQRDGGNVTVGGVLVHSSDKRLKKDISDLSYGLEHIMKLRPKEYYWKNREQEFKSLGLIAQDVQKIIENIVHQRNDEDKTLSVSYTELIPVLINAIQEQQEEIGALKEELEKYKKLEARIKALEKSQNN